MREIFNGTPHAINVVSNASFDATIRKFTVDTPEIIQSIPSNGMLNAIITAVDLPAVDGIPVFGKTVAGVDTLPDGYDLYIVSAMYGAAAKQAGADTSKLYTVADPVYSPDGRTILGCRGICPVI
jgi:hypothetical protein